jgi:hypothetical protein
VFSCRRPSYPDPGVEGESSGGSTGAWAEFDACVIGTGAGGGVTIQELAEVGFRVVEACSAIGPPHLLLSPRI